MRNCSEAEGMPFRGGVRLGLGSVDLVMEVGSSADITISDKEAWEIRRGSGRFQSIVKHLEQKASVSEQKPSVACLSSAAFYRLRVALRLGFGVSRASVRPSSRVA